MCSLDTLFLLHYLTQYRKINARGPESFLLWLKQPLDVAYLSTTLSVSAPECRDAVPASTVEWKVKKSTDSVHAQLKPGGYTAGCRQPLEVSKSLKAELETRIKFWADILF